MYQLLQVSSKVAKNEQFIRTMKIVNFVHPVLYLIIIIVYSYEYIKVDLFGNLTNIMFLKVYFSLINIIFDSFTIVIIGFYIITYLIYYFNQLEQINNLFRCVSLYSIEVISRVTFIENIDSIEKYHLQFEEIFSFIPLIWIFFDLV